MVEEDLKIEVLFPETANLYGDTHNMVYLKLLNLQYFHFR